MLLHKLILISVILVGSWFAAVNAKFKYPIKKITSCGPVVMKQCWCLAEVPCKSRNKKSQTEDEIPIIDEKNLVTARLIKNNINRDSPSELSLVGKHLEGVEKNAFDNFTGLTRLDLSNNKIAKLPAYVFIKLKNLEYLSLANNGLKGTKMVFAGLNNLKTLDLTNNRLTKVLDDKCFFGLTNSCNILIEGVNGIKSIGTDAFGNESCSAIEDKTIKDTNKEEPRPKSIVTRSARFKWVSGAGFTAQLCIKDNSVQRLDFVKPFKTLTSDCKEIELISLTLSLEDLGISKFEKGWYRLNDKNQVPSALSSIHITGNNIARVTSDLVNELPNYITWLNLENNKIERLDEGTFQHRHIFSLLLNHNLISEIEDNTFDMPKLYQLYLQDNRLNNTKFAATLPTSLSSLDLERNEITEISPDSFSNLKKLSYLNLDNNRITRLQSQCMRGMAMGSLILSRNKITTVEPGAFENLHIGLLTLNDNDISNIETGVFKGINIQRLSIANNKLTKISNETFNLAQIEYLDMSGNHITEIERGAVNNLHQLKELDISKNPIKGLMNGALFGLNKAKRTQVHVAETPIEIIQGGLFNDVS